MISKNTRFLIVGLGLIGGSYAMALKKQGYHVDAIDIDESSIAYALQHGIVDNASTCVFDFLLDADFIICCLYPSKMIDWIATYQHHMKQGALLTDVSGVKCTILSTIQRMLRKDIEFLSSHPMAGKEVRGVQHADDTIFQDANFIITPTSKNSDAALEKIRNFAQMLGFSTISVLCPQQHDIMVAFVSQLTHVIAISLMNTNDTTHLHSYTGDSFRELTRIANINEHLWSELFLLNKDNLVHEMDAFIKELTTVKQALLDEDVKQIKKLCIQSTKRRKLFEKEALE